MVFIHVSINAADDAGIVPTIEPVVTCRDNACVVRESHNKSNYSALTLNPSPDRHDVARRGTSTALVSPSPSEAFGRRGRGMRAKDSANQLT